MAATRRKEWSRKVIYNKLPLVAYSWQLAFERLGHSPCAKVALTESAASVGIPQTFFGWGRGLAVSMNGLSEVFSTLFHSGVLLPEFFQMFLGARDHGFHGVVGKDSFPSLGAMAAAMFLDRLFDSFGQADRVGRGNQMANSLEECLVVAGAGGNHWDSARHGLGEGIAEAFAAKGSRAKEIANLVQFFRFRGGRQPMDDVLEVEGVGHSL